MLRMKGQSALREQVNPSMRSHHLFSLLILGVTECLKFTLEPQSADVQAKKSLSLSCSAETDNQPIEYTWKRDGRTFRTTLRRTVEEDGTQSVLKIDPVQKNDAGSYTCEARRRKFRENHEPGCGGRCLQ